MIKILACGLASLSASASLQGMYYYGKDGADQEDDAVSPSAASAPMMDFATYQTGYQTNPALVVFANVPRISPIAKRATSPIDTIQFVNYLATLN